MPTNEAPKSPRAEVLEYVAKFFKARDNGRYGVVSRGPLNWATFPFDKYKSGAAVLCDTTQLFASRSGPSNGMRSMALAVELMTVLPDLEASLKEDVGDVFYQDCTDMMRALTEAVRADESNLIFGYEEGSDHVVEVHDSGLRVQGVIFQIRLYY